jgi:PTS system N-acetylgalactosamine-specific IIA component
MTSSVRGIVAAHGSLAPGLVSAVEVITGRGAQLRALSNEGLGAAAVVAELGRLLDETGANVVFTDLPAGSCTLAARRLQKDRPALTVVVGVNLPMLLEFALRDGDANADVAAAVERGKEHVKILAGTNVG